MNLSIKKFNVVLAMSSAIALFGYIFLSNYTFSQNYQYESLKRHLNQAQNLTIVTGDMTKEDALSISSLTLFAQRTGMIEAKEIYSLFEDSGVALTRLGN